MNRTNGKWMMVVALVVVGFGMLHFRAERSEAQGPAGVGVGDAVALLGRSISTQVVTIKVENQRGEPRIVTGKVRFDRPVRAYWVAVVGSDVQFDGTTEKPWNRQMFSVDPYAKIINGNEVEVSGKLGVRDGSGDWDDRYDGTLTVAVTAVLGN